MEFNSQICTTRSQSEALLKLGLKKETADMYYTNAGLPFIKDEFHLECKSFKELSNNLSEISPFTFIPAWSLHRLMEMSAVNNGRILINIDIPLETNFYDELVKTIESLIKRGLFNQEYLEEQK